MSAAPALRAAEAAPPGPLSQPQLGDKEFRRIAAILHEDSGIHLPEGKVSLVYSRLAKRLRALGLASFRDYCDLIASDAGADERQRMLSALTTNVTRFFREPHHFTDLAQSLRGGWLDHAKRGGKLRIWSAGCSSGEEPYTMALTILAEAPDAARYDIKILASDIDPMIVAKARAGTYSAEAVSPAPAAARERWMERQPDGSYAMGAEMRALISFRELNLMADWPIKGAFQAIFCRNVAIYFDEPTQERLWGRFAERLAPDGRLYIGHSERTADPRLKSDGMTVYRRAEGAAK
jgi:chemotaxis protein methyltransferase CheR